MNYTRSTNIILGIILIMLCTSCTRNSQSKVALRDNLLKKKEKSESEYGGTFDAEPSKTKSEKYVRDQGDTLFNQFSQATIGIAEGAYSGYEPDKNTQCWLEVRKVPGETNTYKVKTSYRDIELTIQPLVATTDESSTQKLKYTYKGFSTDEAKKTYKIEVTQSILSGGENQTAHVESFIFDPDINKHLSAEALILNCTINKYSADFKIDRRDTYTFKIGTYLGYKPDGKMCWMQIKSVLIREIPRYEIISSFAPTQATSLAEHALAQSERINRLFAGYYIADVTTGDTFQRLFVTPKEDQATKTIDIATFQQTKYVMQNFGYAVTEDGDEKIKPLQLPVLKEDTICAIQKFESGFNEPRLPDLTEDQRKKLFAPSQYDSQRMMLGKIREQIAEDATTLKSLPKLAIDENTTRQLLGIWGEPCSERTNYCLNSFKIEKTSEATYKLAQYATCGIKSVTNPRIEPAQCPKDKSEFKNHTVKVYDLSFSKKQSLEHDGKTDDIYHADLIRTGYHAVVAAPTQSLFFQYPKRMVTFNAYLAQEVPVCAYNSNAKYVMPSDAPDWVTLWNQLNPKNPVKLKMNRQVIPNSPNQPENLLFSYEVLNADDWDPETYNIFKIDVQACDFFATHTPLQPTLMVLNTQGLYLNMSPTRAFAEPRQTSIEWEQPMIRDLPQAVDQIDYIDRLPAVPLDKLYQHQKPEGGS